MKTINGFKIPDNCTSVPDYIIMREDRRVVMGNQINMNYTEYLRYKLDNILSAFSKDIEENWRDRSPDDHTRHNHYQEEIESVTTELKSFNEACEVMLVKN